MDRIDSIRTLNQRLSRVCWTQAAWFCVENARLRFKLRILLIIRIILTFILYYFDRITIVILYKYVYIFLFFIEFMYKIRHTCVLFFIFVCGVEVYDKKTTYSGTEAREWRRWVKGEDRESVISRERTVVKGWTGEEDSKSCALLKKHFKISIRIKKHLLR